MTVVVGRAGGGSRQGLVFAGLGLVGLLGFFLLQDLAGKPLNTLLLYLPGADKVIHCLEFLVVFVLCHYLAGLITANSSRRFKLALAVTLMLAVGDELQQTLVADRNVELADFFANLCGLALGVAVVRTDWRRFVRGLVVIMAVLVTVVLAAGSYVRLKDYNRGLLYEGRQEFGLARQAFLRALASGFESHGLYNGLGWVEIESVQGDPVKAVEYAEKALSMRPTDPDTLDTYGWALHHVGRSEEALGYLLRAYEGKPRMFCIHYHVGVVLLALGRRADAQDHLERQIREHPTSLEAQRAQALLPTLQQDSEK
jgi:tetratricopeptide (TPR) repeat protein